MVEGFREGLAGVEESARGRHQVEVLVWEVLRKDETGG